MNSYEAIEALYDEREGEVNLEAMDEQARQAVEEAARSFLRATEVALDGWLHRATGESPGYIAEWIKDKQRRRYSMTLSNVQCEVMNRLQGIESCHAMGRFYRMEVEIMDHDSKKSKAIKTAAAHEWPFTEWEEDEDGLGCSAEASLCGGEREEEFAERLTTAIWRANGAYCDVLITAHLEIEPPSQEHQLDEEDYERLIGTI